MKINDKVKVIANIDYCGVIGYIAGIDDNKARSIKVVFELPCETCGKPEEFWCFYDADEIEVIINETQ